MLESLLESDIYFRL